MLSADDIADLLYALATGYLDRARSMVLTSEDLSDDERDALKSIVEDDDTPPHEMARRIGDALRARDVDRALVNECYRLAFYLSGASADLADNPLYAYFLAHRSGRLLDKWVHYFAVYHRHLERWRGRRPRVLEIGVYQGGSLDLWDHYFGPGATLVGIDIDEAAVRMADPSRTVVLGDQADPAFLRSVVERYGPFDIVIDDGGHTMEQQIVSIETLFPAVVDGGIYLVEDTHTSYWPSHGGGLRSDASFVEWAKARVDDLHAYHRDEPVHPVWADQLGAVHWYDSLVVFDKELRSAPFCETIGGSDFLYRPRYTQTLVGEMLATRDAAVRELEQRRGTFDEDLRVAMGELDALRPRAMELEAEMRRIDDELTVTRNDLLEAWAQLRSMRHTLSWRITGPLRVVRRRFGRE